MVDLTLRMLGSPFCGKLVPVWAALLVIQLPAMAQISFSETGKAAGIANKGKNWGISCVDYDGDGLDDIYVCRRDDANLLYRNLGNGVFQDMAAQVGLAYIGTSTMAAWADYDNDGDPDLYLGNRDESNRLFRNNGSAGFDDVTAKAGVGDPNTASAVLWADVDNDGLVDIYVANMSKQNSLFMNNGDGTFSNKILQSGAVDTKIAMGSLFFDYDNDGDQDLYLIHDAYQDYILYRNDGKGVFTDVSVPSGTNYKGQGMGVDVADLDNDGDLDIHITNLLDNALLRNNGDGTFTEIGKQAGINDKGMGWGTVCFDADNDGLRDIYTVNDSYFSPYPNVMYRNKGGLSFQNVSAGTSLASMYGGYGVASADLNLDGRIDLALANYGNDGNQLFLNSGNAMGNWLALHLEGTVSNRSAIGARIEVYVDGVRQIDEVTAGSGYASQNSMTQHFGLGSSAAVDSVVVRWPNGNRENLGAMGANQRYHILEGQGVAASTEFAGVSAVRLEVFPNPSMESVFFRVSPPAAGHCRLVLTDLSGTEVKVIHDGWMGTGEQRFECNTGGMAAGTYYLVMQGQGKSEVSTVLIMGR